MKQTSTTLAKIASIYALALTMILLGSMDLYSQNPPTITGITWTSYNFNVPVTVDGQQCTVAVTAWNAGGTSNVDCDWWLGAFCLGNCDGTPAAELDDDNICSVISQVIGDMVANNPQGDATPPDCETNFTNSQTKRIRVPRCLEEDTQTGCYTACGNDLRCETEFAQCMFGGGLITHNQATFEIGSGDCDTGCKECACESL